jgi:hypothetical protein
MAQCIHCSKKADTHLPYLHPLCRQCFCNVIEKRIRRYTRLNKVFSKGDRIIAVGELNQYLIPHIIKGLPVEIESRKTAPVKDSNAKVVVNWTLDDETCAFLEQLLTGKKREMRHQSILKTVTDKELLLFAGFNKLRFKPNRKNSEVQRILDTLEAKHPETKFSLMKSMEHLRN